MFDWKKVGIVLYRRQVNRMPGSVTETWAWRKLVGHGTERRIAHVVVAKEIIETLARAFPHWSGVLECSSVMCWIERVLRSVECLKESGLPRRMSQ
jgi:hypothetical protein